MSSKPFGFRGIKVIALQVLDFDRANKFYSETLGLPPAYEGSVQVGYSLDKTILMLKSERDASPTAMPNPRVTIETENARDTEQELRARKVVIPDPVQIYDETHLVGSFLDSEGNKIWFCSYV
ncbi:MAG: VOC family protein [Verrucomicrobia bacterium]|nr:VOC family protein [Verrucomicrobiota bacterium]MBV9672482.1 VOC family protein [Verrucomicrobiota bacterium]